MMEKNRHGLCIFVENEFGVIQRVTNLFSARGMNIETIHTTPIDDKSNISQISISLFENKKNIELIQSLLERLIVVHGVMGMPLSEEEKYFSFIFIVSNKNIQEVKNILDIKKIQYFVIINTFCLAGKKNTNDLTNDFSDIQGFVQVKNYNIF